MSFKSLGNPLSSDTDLRHGRACGRETCQPHYRADPRTLGATSPTAVPSPLLPPPPRRRRRP